MTEQLPLPEEVEMPPRDTQEVYQMHQLAPDSKQIRILNIKSTNDNEPIKCSLEVVNVETDTGFTALSYVWGTYAIQPDTIICDDIRFEVTSNCHSALWHLRKKLGSFRIWVDAICINQQDGDEKSQQIPLMGDIYSKSALVYVWLGEDTSEDKSAEKSMAYLSTAGVLSFIQQFPNGTKKYRPYAAAWTLFTSCFTPARHRYLVYFRTKRQLRQYIDWTDLNTLLYKDWTRRVWTYQEILLASRPVLVCETYHLPWSDATWSLLLLANFSNDSRRRCLTTWIDLLQDRRTLSLPDHTAGASGVTIEEYVGFIDKVARARKVLDLVIFCIILVVLLVPIVPAIVLGIIFDDRFLAIFVFALPALYVFLDGMDHFTGGNIAIADNDQSQARGDIISGIYRRESLDPRDKAYGMWSVLRQRGATNLPLPSYNREIGEVHQTLAVQLIQTTRRLDALYLAAARGHHGYPSWVPDWSAGKSNTWVDLDQTASALIPKNHLTSPDETGEIWFNQAYTVLNVSARERGTIQDCFVFHKTSEEARAVEQDLHLENLRVMTRCADLADPKPGTYFDGAWQGTYWLMYHGVQESRSPHLEMQSVLYLAAKYENEGRTKELEKAFHLWFNGNPLNKTMKKLLETQILVCNALAEYDRRIYLASTSESTARLLFSAPNAETNDRMIEIKGLERLLLVRSVNDSNRAVQLVSPVKFPWPRLAKPLRISERFGSEPDFVRYQIY